MAQKPGVETRLSQLLTREGRIIPTRGIQITVEQTNAWNARAGPGRDGISQQDVDRTAAYLFFRERPTDNFDRRPAITKEAYVLRSHSKTMAEAREKTAPFNLEGIAQDITCPIFIIGSKSDDITRYTDAERLSREVSGPVELLLIEGASHVAHNRAHLFKTQSADWMAGHLKAN